jgi:2-pyrone-4,6-dicarboxylate lactonase
LKLFPEDAWDCHAHVIEDTRVFPLWAGRGYDPPIAPVGGYLMMLDRLGIARGVLVQPSVYGFDNRCMLDALDRAEGRLTGIAVPAPDTSARELEEMHRLGARGVRCNLLNPGGLDPKTVIGWEPQLRELGWRVELHIAVDTIADLRAYVAQFSVPVVIDHMGRPAVGSSQLSSGFLQLVELVREGVCFVKLSAPYRFSTQPAPWTDVTAIARALIAANASVCLWGTDWPHTDTRPDVDEAQLLAALEAWCPDDGTRDTVLVQNPTVVSTSTTH